jgi:hypothetical protein
VVLVQGPRLQAVVLVQGPRERTVVRVLGTLVQAGRAALSRQEKGPWQAAASPWQRIPLPQQGTAGAVSWQSIRLARAHPRREKELVWM